MSKVFSFIGFLKNLLITMYKNNSRDSIKFKGCSPLQVSCKLKDFSSEIGYYSFTKRLAFIKTNH